MATTMPWLPGWQAAWPRRRTARTRDIPAPPMARGEHLLLALHGVVATDRALFCAGPDWSRLGWEQVTSADRHERGMVVTAWAPGLPPRTIVAVERATPLLSLARERIAWTTLLTTRVLIGDRPARVTARRRPGTGELLWLVAADAPLAEPALEEALAHLRAVHWGS